MAVKLVCAISHGGTEGTEGTKVSLSKPLWSLCLCVSPIRGCKPATGNQQPATVLKRKFL
jgi:hypothetical protein